MRSRLIARLAAAQIAILSLIFALTAQAQAQSGTTLMGVVTLDEPVAAGTIYIYSGSSLLQAEPNRRFANGTFAIALNPQVVALLRNTDLRVLVQVQAPDAPRGDSSSLTLGAVLHDFDPETQVAFINPVTTVVEAYLDDNPNLRWEEAAGRIAEVLGTPTDTSFQSTHMLDFDSAAFVAAGAARGGFHQYVHAVGRMADRGETVNFGKGPAFRDGKGGRNHCSRPPKTTPAPGSGAIQPDFEKLIIGIAKGIAKDATQSTPTSEFAGWIIDTIVDGKANEHKDSLDQVSKQLDQISTQISQLEGEIKKEIADLKATVIAAQNYIVYQQVAVATNPAVDDLEGLRQRLYFLALAAAGGELHPDLASDLGRDINSKANTDLASVQNGVAGINSTPGLISQWAKVLLDQNPSLKQSFPTLFSNAYLAPATAQYYFYLGAQFTGFYLRIEYAHSLLATNSPILAKAIETEAIKSFNSNFNTDMKLVAANAHASINGQNYYPSLALPADDLIADARSALVWLNHPPCAASNQAQPCNFAIRQNATGNIGYPLAGDFLRNFSDGGVKFSLPSVQEWNNLVAPLKTPTLDFNAPLNSLNQRGFALGNQLDSVFPGGNPTPSSITYWASDSVFTNPTNAGPFYPDIVNWFFDLRGPGPGLFQIWISGPGVLVHPFLPPAARILPRAFDPDLLYKEDPNVLGVPGM